MRHTLPGKPKPNSQLSNIKVINSFKLTESKGKRNKKNQAVIIVRLTRVRNKKVIHRMFHFHKYKHKKE